MKSFVGRNKELEILDNRYHSDHFEFGYIYGQRRIGKTSLLNHFEQGKKSLMLYATDSEDIDIRNSFSNVLSKKVGIGLGSFSSWYDFFEKVDEYFGDDEGIMVIDEYPNITLTRDGKRKKTDFTSSLQRAIDTLFIKRRFTLVITGSNVSFMEKEMNDNRAPLYQRNTFSILLKKLEWNEAIRLFDGIDNNRKVELLSLTNTFPYYLSLIDINDSLDGNLDRLFYGYDALFVDDPSKIITSDKAKGGLYASLLKNIALGYNIQDKLCELLNEDSSKVSKYINELVNDNILRKINRFNSNKYIKYEIVDPMLAFYYRFIRENVEPIKNGYGESIKEEQKNAINDFIHHQFENLCTTYLECLDKNGKLETLYIDFYNFSLDNTSLGRSIEIDILGARNKHLLVGECKFSKNPRSLKDYYDMKEDVSIDIFKPYPNKDYYLFGSSGFTSDLKSVKDEHLHLVDLNTLFE